MTTLNREYGSFKLAILLSLTAHLALLLFVILSPYLPKPSKKGTIHYVQAIYLPGGGGGGGPAGGRGAREENLAETALPERETLRDLTTPQKMQEATSSSLRHPVENKKKEEAPKKDKKAVIQKPQQTSTKNSGIREGTQGSKGGTGGSGGSGVKIGVGNGTGSGSGYSSQIGLSSFPYTYYLQIITNRISGNWFKSLVDPGISGTFQVIVYFKIHRDGRISDLKIDDSSGISSLDMSAMRAVQSSNFPPLPASYEDEYLVLRLIFEHTK